jgi:hypothetical protein
VIAATDNPGIFADLETELAGLPGRYGPPTGCLVPARGHGIGGRMIEALIARVHDARVTRP